MRQQYKTLLLALVAAMAVGAFASATASALNTPKWTIEKSEFIGEESINITNTTPITISGKLSRESSIKFKIECPTVVAEKADIFGGSKGGNVKLQFELCKWKEPAGCNPPSVLNSDTLNLSLEDAVAGKEPIFSKFESTTENIFMRWTQPGCALEGVYTYTGTPRCEWQEPQVAQIAKLCEFTETSGSTLLYGSKNPIAILGTVKLELSGLHKGQKWGARPS